MGRLGMLGRPAREDSHVTTAHLQHSLEWHPLAWSEADTSLAFIQVVHSEGVVTAWWVGKINFRDLDNLSVDNESESTKPTMDSRRPKDARGNREHQEEVYHRGQVNA